MKYHTIPSWEYAILRREEGKYMYIKLKGCRHSQIGQWLRENYMEVRSLFFD